MPVGHRFLLLGKLFICSECFNSLGYERFMSLTALPLEEQWALDLDLFAEIDANYNRIEGRRPYCVNCTDDLARQQPSNT